MKLRCALAIVLGLAACGDDGGSNRDSGDGLTCDQQTNPTCCGAPDHDCGGAACVDGMCVAQPLVSSINASDLAIAGTTLYFVEPVAGLVEKIQTDGTGRATVASTPDTPAAVAATADTVVWATLGALPRDGAIVRLGPGDTTPVTIATMEHVPCDLALDASGVVWTSFGSGSAPYSPGELRSLPTAGTVTTLQPTLNHPCGLAVDGNTVFFTTFGTNLINSVDGAVTMAPRLGGTPLTIATNRHGPRFVAVTGDFVYWTDEGTSSRGYTDGRVMRLSRSGGAPEVLSDETRPHGIVVDRDAAYWVASNDGAVRKLALDSRTKTTIATLPGRALTVMVADDRFLYLLAGPDAGGGTGGQLVKVAK